MLKEKKIILFGILLGAMFFSVLARSAGIEIVHEVKHDTSAPLSKVSLLTYIKQDQKSFINSTLLKPANALSQNIEQTFADGEFPMVSGVHFQGLGVGFNQPVPNDYSVLKNPSSHVTGAVGLTQYVELVHDGFAVFNKKDGKLIYGPVPIKTLWDGFGKYCNSMADPTIRYDQLAHRWIIMHTGLYVPSLGARSENYICIAVSANDDATGFYHRYAYQFNDGPDYNKLGVWPDAYYLALQMQSFTNGFEGTKVCAANRPAMLNGEPADMPCFYNKDQKEHLYPADLDGQILPENIPGYYLGITADKKIQLWKYKIDWGHPETSHLSGPYLIEDMPSFIPACDKNAETCIPQPRTLELLRSYGSRLMHRLAYRQIDPDNGVLLVNHAVSGTNVPSAIRWYQIALSNKANPKVVQQGTYMPTTDSRRMGSIAMDKNGNIALGYNISSKQIYPSIAITGRTSQDMPGVLRKEKLIQEGSGVKTFKSWSDYSSMMIDPEDDCTFWYTAQYQKIDGPEDPSKINGGNDWSTYVASFKFPNCQ